MAEADSGAGGPFASLDGYPRREDAIGVVQRLVDSLGFRFRWASEGLRETDADFRAAADAASIGELIGHVRDLARTLADHLALGRVGNFPDLAPRDEALATLAALRAHLEETDAAEFFRLEVRGHPVWHLLNGQLADALTHTGQIAMLRRIAGNPVPRHRVFHGRPGD